MAADGTLYPVDKMDAHRRALLHLAVSVFVFSGADMLLQRRAAGKYHCGGQWANTCCTHPHWEEPLEAAARRRLQQEMGFGVALTPAETITYRAPVTGGLTEHERVQIFYGLADRTQLALTPDPDEVMDIRWISRTALDAEIRAHPHQFAPWLRIYMKRWDELGLPQSAATD